MAVNEVLPESKSLAGKVALVTGASAGIGAATAELLAGLGMQVAVTARRGDRLTEMAEQLGHGSRAYPGDLMDATFVDELTDRVAADFGRLDAVVNNAGMLVSGGYDEIDVDRACAMVRLNVESAFRLSFRALRTFKAAGGGHLLNVASVLGTKVRPGYGAYCGTKYALEALSEALRMELAGTRIRMTVIEPGLVMTELHDHLPEHPSARMGDAKVLEPIDIARTVAFALSQPAHVNVARIMALPSDQAV